MSRCGCSSLPSVLLRHRGGGTAICHPPVGHFFCDICTCIYRLFCVASVLRLGLFFQPQHSFQMGGACCMQFDVNLHICTRVTIASLVGDGSPLLLCPPRGCPSTLFSWDPVASCWLVITLATVESGKLLWSSIWRLHSVDTFGALYISWSVSMPVTICLHGHSWLTAGSLKMFHF